MTNTPYRTSQDHLVRECYYGSSDGSFATFTAIRHASSRMI
jgi:hypothetical protein